jgi:hypothetical protein
MAVTRSGFLVVWPTCFLSGRLNWSWQAAHARIFIHSCSCYPFAIFFMQYWGLPQYCKSRRASEPRRQGRRCSRSTASAWQRRIWSSPAFPQGKKDGINSTRSSSSPWVYSSQSALMQCSFNAQTYATLLPSFLCNTGVKMTLPAWWIFSSAVGPPVRWCRCPCSAVR